MKKKIINGCLNVVKKKFPEYDEEKISVIKYGLESIYLTITKLIIIALLAYIIGILKEVVIFLLIYNVMRTFSFGLHATKSWICLVSSTLIFISSPLICKYVYIPIWCKVITGIILLFLYFKNAPADTKKRPIVNPKRRLFFKYISVLTCILFIFLSIFIKNNFISNCFILSLIVQACMISPFVYKIFGLPYNNYLSYQAA
ncbi:MAG: accessory gene regulator B family protein [Bacilli bacterium]|nr:accessory gene regulator B family protein [Bacilli bacterium]